MYCSVKLVMYHYCDQLNKINMRRLGTFGAARRTKELCADVKFCVFSS